MISSATTIMKMWWDYAQIAACWTAPSHHQDGKYHYPVHSSYTASTTTTSSSDSISTMVSKRRVSKSSMSRRRAGPCVRQGPPNQLLEAVSPFDELPKKVPSTPHKPPKRDDWDAHSSPYDECQPKNKVIPSPKMVSSTPKRQPSDIREMDLPYDERPSTMKVPNSTPKDNEEDWTSKDSPFDERQPSETYKTGTSKRERRSSTREEPCDTHYPHYPQYPQYPPTTKIPKEILVARPTHVDGIPVEILVPDDADEASAISQADSFSVSDEGRTLTPHPSFDRVVDVGPNDFHHLYQASLKLDEQDWPSDEDGPVGFACQGFKFWSGGSVHKKNLATPRDVMMIMRDLDDEGNQKTLQSKRSQSKYRLV